MKKSELFLLLLIVMVFQGCKTPHKPISDTDVVDGKTIANYLKTIQYSKDGKHLFGHETIIMMGVNGEFDWEFKKKTEIGNTIFDQKSDVKVMTGNLPAIMGYDAFKLQLDITDGSNRKEEVETTVAALKLYRESGGLLAFDWHMRPIMVPSYKERAY